MQQNITFRNSPPSASSMRDGQIVFARNSKGVAMYTKQGSQLFHTQFNSSANIDKSLNKITPRSVEAGDLSYTLTRKWIVKTKNSYIPFRLTSKK